ncbi:MAG: phosphopantetheine-binding protein [Erysipelotrichaceae bacterium]
MNTFDVLKKELAPKVKANAEIKLDSTMQELGVDSLDLVDVVLSMEEQFSITFEDEELQNLATVTDVVNLIDAKRK